MDQRCKCNKNGTIQMRGENMGDFFYNFCMRRKFCITQNQETIRGIWQHKYEGKIVVCVIKLYHKWSPKANNTLEENIWVYQR